MADESAIIKLAVERIQALYAARGFATPESAVRQAILELPARGTFPSDDEWMRAIDERVADRRHESRRFTSDAGWTEPLTKESEADLGARERGE